MAIVNRRQLLRDLADVYRDAGTSAALKGRIGELFLRVAPDKISDAALFSYLTAVADDAFARHRLIHSVVRRRLARLTRAQINQVVAHYQGVISGLEAEPALSDDQARVLAACQRFVRVHLRTRSETEPAQQAVASVNLASLTEADVETLESALDDLPDSDDPLVAADEQDPEPEP